MFARKAQVVISKFKMIEEKSKLLDPDKDIFEKYTNDWMYYNATRTAIGKELYELCKTSLEEFQEDLTPKERGEIILAYIESWRKTKSCLSLEDLGFDKEQFMALAKNFDSEKFSNWRYTLKTDQVMFAGLNLSNTKITLLRISDVTFFLTNFENADIRFDSREHYFLACNMSKFKPNGGGLLKSLFLKCNLAGADLTSLSLESVTLQECAINNLKYNKSDRLYFDKCHAEQLEIKISPPT